MRRSGWLVLILALAWLLAVAPSASAHRNGCHAWHSCPSDTGSYICGDTGHSNYCPSQTPPIYSYTPPSTYRYTPPQTYTPPRTYAPSVPSRYTPTALTEPEKDYGGWIWGGVIVGGLWLYGARKGSTPPGKS